MRRDEVPNDEVAEREDDYRQTPRGQLVEICAFGNIRANAEDIVDTLIANAHLLDAEVRDPTPRFES